MPDDVRICPENDHFVYACRCGRTISLPRFAEAYTVCECGRRHSFDTRMLVIRAPSGEMEQTG
jgi:hypothetical protein